MAVLQGLGNITRRIVDAPGGVDGIVNRFAQAVCELCTSQVSDGVGSAVTPTGEEAQAKRACLRSPDESIAYFVAAYEPPDVA